MINVQISLPDDLASRAKSAGLLSDQAIGALLEDAMRRAAAARFMEAAKRVQDSDIEPMDEQEIVDIVREVRRKAAAKS